MKKSLLVIALLLGSTITVSLKHLNCKEYDRIKCHCSEIFYSCTSCHPGHYRVKNAQNQYECHKCAPGCKRCKSLKTCKACHSGFQLNESGSCESKPVTIGTTRKDTVRTNALRREALMAETLKKEAIRKENLKREAVKREESNRAAAKRQSDPRNSVENIPV